MRFSGEKNKKLRRNYETKFVTCNISTRIHEQVMTMKNNA